MERSKGNTTKNGNLREHGVGFFASHRFPCRTTAHVGVCVFLSKQPDNRTWLTANHFPLLGALMAVGRGKWGGVYSLTHLSLLLSVQHI